MHRFGLRRASTTAIAVIVIALSACSSSKSSAPNGSTTTSGSSPSRATPAVVASVPSPHDIAFDRAGALWFTSSFDRGKSATDGIWYIPHGGKPLRIVPMTQASGLAWVGDRLYVTQLTSAGHGRVAYFSGFDGRHFASRHVVLDNVPTGEHTIGSIVAEPRGRLLIAVGSAGDKPGDRTGRVLSFGLDGGPTSVRATGLRSGFGLAVYGPLLLVTDSGRDDLGAFKPPEELNEFDPAGPVVNFGYPKCYNQGGLACAGTKPPITQLAAHASPVHVGVKGDVAYVGENGSSFPENPTGSDVQRVDLRTGKATLFWHSPVAHDPIAVTMGPDGRLYVGLFASNKIVRFDV